MQKSVIAVASISTVVVLLAIGFVVGFVTRAGSGDGLRQDLLKELLAAADAIKTGVTLSDLAAHEQRILTAVQLAHGTLNNEQNIRVEKAIEGLDGHTYGLARNIRLPS